MTFPKMRMRTSSASTELIAAIAAYLPEAINEIRAPSGEIRREVDYAVLCAALGSVSSDRQERYRLDWPGKQAALLESNSVISKTFRPSLSESKDFSTSRNLLIEGDNLEAMKLLREGYLGKVDIIYIDPPYNTGSDLIYKDSFRSKAKEYLEETEQMSAEKGRLNSNLQSNGRFHSDWLSMMYSRLRLARQLLADSGVIFISIDDNERANLEKLCEEVFGASNFLGCFVWKRRSGAMDAVSNLSADHEYILVYSKRDGVLKGVERTFEKYSNPDNDPRGPWIADNLSAGKPGGDTYYTITDPKTGREFLPPRGRYWPYSRQTMATKISEGRVLFPGSTDGTPMLKRFSSEAVKPVIPVSSWIERPGAGGGQSTIRSPMNSAATKALKTLFGDKVFSFPKPVELIQALINQGGEKDVLVMDFFAGSGTTGHAVMACNAADGGNRRFVLVQAPEEIDGSTESTTKPYATISDLAKERIRRAGQQLLQSGSASGWSQDVGFRVLKIDSSNMADVYYRPDELKQDDLLTQVDNIRPSRTAEDLLFQVLLDWGVDLSLPIAREDIDGREVFFVDDNALAACFAADGSVDEALVKQIAQRQPLRVVFRDSGFASDNARINVEQIFKALSPSTEVRTL
ncbi:site-specific DNA-methyltransferase [Luteimonas sp. A277]